MNHEDALFIGEVTTSQSLAIYDIGKPWEFPFDQNVQKIEFTLNVQKIEFPYAFSSN